MSATGDLAVALAEAARRLARRFSHGATLWSVAPAEPAHAHHVAVEFVHPVIVGKRALPAVAVDGTGRWLLGQLEACVRPGDTVVVMGPAGHPDVAAVLAGAEGWGAQALWLGPPPAPAAPAGGRSSALTLVVDPSTALGAEGGLVAAYHVLWELTHVWLEHPGLLTEPAEAVRS